MAAGTGSSGRGTKKGSGGKFRTPKLSDAQKRSNKLSRALKPPGATTTVSTSNSAVPF